MTDQRTWIRGVSQPLPAGETLLWEGAPEPGALARHALHLRGLAFYFGMIILAGLAGAVREGVMLPQLLTTLSIQLVLSGLVIGGVYAYAVLTARSTVYAVTDRRVVLKHGLVLPTTINIPFRLVESAWSRTFPDGTGQVALAIRRPDRLGFIHLWPHVRPWRLRAPEPMLRGLSDTETVIGVLRVAAAATGPVADAPPAGAAETAPAPAPHRPAQSLTPHRAGAA